MTVAVMVIGAGRVGAALARLLTHAGHAVIVIERRADRAAHVTDLVPAARVVTADGTDPAALEAAGIRTVDVVAAVTGDDACNAMVGALARLQFAVARTIARIVDPTHAWLFDEGSGVDIAIDQADLLTRLIVEEISLGEVATLVKLRRGDFTLVEERVVPGSRADGSTVAELDLPAACVLVAVLRGDGVLPCKGELVLAAGDEVLAVVHAGSAHALALQLGSQAPV